MNAAFGTLALQLMAVALCACGVTVILEIAALAVAAAVTGGLTDLQGPRPIALFGAWLALSVQLARAWILGRP
jgi:hypothetical protein